MTRFPLEIYELILFHMAPVDVARVAPCSKALYGAACRLLYMHAKVRFVSGNLDLASKSQLQQLSARSDLRHCVRHFSLCNKASTFWTSGHSTLAGLLLSVVFEYPDRIQTFRWDASGVFTGKAFKNLESLQCTKIQSNAELEWVQQHVANCQHLRWLRLGLTALPLPGDGSYLFSSVRSKALRAICLHRIDLSGVDPAGLLNGATRILELRHCPGSGTFLAQACHANLARYLQGLTLVGNIALGVIMEFVRCLGPTLQRLALCLGGVQQLPCLLCVMPKSPGLRSLVLDFRLSLSSAESSWMFSSGDFLKLTKAYPRLETLGLPLDLRDATRRTYTRAPLPVWISFTHVEPAGANMT